MSDANDVLPLNSLAGKAILSIATGNKLGIVRDSYIDPVNGVLIGLTLATIDDKIAVLDYQNIHKFGSDALMAASDEAIKIVEDKPFPNWPNSHDLIGTKLITESGSLLGKIADIFAHRGITRAIGAKDNKAVFDATIAETKRAPDGSLVFANFVDFDTLYGHRRDVPGYAAALESFDARLPEFRARLRPGDLALITADHGCDPTWTGTDHTRELVPMLWLGPGIAPRDLGQRATFADMGQTVARHLGLSPLAHGQDCFAP